MSRRLATTLAVLLVLSTVAAPTSGTQADVAIQSVTTSIDQPAPGENFTVTVRIANLETSSGPVEVTDVFVRQSGTTREFARVDDAGTIAPGGTLSVPVTLQIDESGEKRLTVAAVVRDADGETERVTYPLFVDVREPDEALVSFAGVDPVASQESHLDVTVTNGDTGPLTNVRLELTGAATVENPERVTASLQSGTQNTYSYRVTFPEAGQRTLTASLTYTTDQDVTRTISREVTVGVDPATIDVEVTPRIATRNGSSVIEAELQQYGNVELRDVQVRAVLDGETVARSRVADVPADGGRIGTLDASELGPGEVTVVTEFTAAGERRTVSESLRFTSDVELDVDSRFRDGLSVIEAELHQYGTVELRDVQVRVEVDGERVVRTTLPNVIRESSRVATFEGREIPGGNVTVVAEYTVGEERRTTTASLRYSPAPTADISLTGVEVTRGESVVTMSGDAANVGSAPTRSVVVSVVEAEGVTPVGPNEEFFVGAVDASEFATFELTANVSDSVETVPVRIEYTVDGERFSRVVSVDVSDAQVQTEANRGGSIPLVPVGVVLLVLTLVVAGVYRWRT